MKADVAGRRTRCGRRCGGRRVGGRMAERRAVRRRRRHPGSRTTAEADQLTSELQAGEDQVTGTQAEVQAMRAILQPGTPEALQGVYLQLRPSQRLPRTATQRARHHLGTFSGFITDAAASLDAEPEHHGLE